MELLNKKNILNILILSIFTGSINAIFFYTYMIIEIIINVKNIYFSAPFAIFIGILSSIIIKKSPFKFITFLCSVIIFIILFNAIAEIGIRISLFEMIYEMPSFHDFIGAFIGYIIYFITIIITLFTALMLYKIKEDN